MSNDVFYGADCELRIGIMADKDTMPTAWFNVEFNSLTLSADRTKVQRPRLGAARDNVLDPLRPRMGLERWSADLVVDGDTLILPRLLRILLGAPATTGASAPYTHLWESGAKTEIYCAIAVRAGTDKVHVLSAVSLGAVSTQFGGENVQDFDIQLALMAISRTREDDWPSGSTTGVTTPAPILRGAFLVDGTAADQIVSAGFTFDRNLQSDAYLPTGTATRLVSYLRPGPAPVHSGQATVRAFGTAYDVLADAQTEFAAEVRLVGVTSGHMVKLAHPKAELTQPQVSIGEGVIERSLSWAGHQDASNPATKISVLNAVSSYA